MSKKLLIYGLAFGSASAALSYIYLTSAIYKGSDWVHLMAILSEFLIIPAVGIFMFIKAYKNETMEFSNAGVIDQKDAVAVNRAQFTIGRAVFMGFFLSIIISAAVSLLYSYIYQFKPGYVAQIIDYRTNAYANSQVALKIQQEKGVVEYQKDVANFAKYLKTEVYTMRAQFVSQLFTGASRGLFLSAIFAYLIRPKTPKRD